MKIPRRAAFAALVCWTLACAIYDSNNNYRAVAADQQFNMDRIGYKGTSPWADIAGPYTDVVLETTKLGDKVVFISNAVAPGYPMLTQLRCQPGSRHLHSVILSVLSYIKDSRPKTLQNIQLYENTDRIVKEYGDDILKNKPKLVFLQKLPDYFDLPYHFVEKYLKNYRELPGEWGNFRVFRLVEGG